MRKFLYIMCSLLCAVFIACSKSGDTAKPKLAEELRKEHHADSLALKVGVLQTEDCLPAFVAKDEGIFDSLGVDVRLCHYTSMLDYDRALTNGKLHGVFTDTKYLEHLNKVPSLGMQQKKTFDMPWQLVSNRKSRIRQLKQFTDKMIAMSRHSVTDYLCDRMIDSIKMNRERVFRIQVNDADLRLRMLLDNEIDAAWLPEPQATVAKKAGHKVLMSSGSRGEKFAVLAFSDKSFGDERIKKQIELFVKAYDTAYGRIKKGGKKYRQRLVKQYFKYDI